MIADNSLSGIISGKLYKVPLEEGLTALLEGNGYRVYKRKGIYQVFKPSANASVGSGADANFHVDYANGLVSLTAVNVSLYDVITAITRQADLEVIFYNDISQSKVNATLVDVPLTDIFALILGGTQYTYVQNENIITIGDRNSSTSSGQALSKSELVQLHYIKADEVMKFLPKNIPEYNIRLVKEQNALLVAGTSEDIVKTRLFLNSIDVPTPQVVINAIVVEYSRDEDLDFGVQFGNDKSGTNGSNNYSFPNLEYNRKGDMAKKFIDALPFFQDNFISKLPTDFYLTIKALEAKGKAKVLAQPSITVLNGNRATIDVGQTQYYKIVAGTSENPTYNFQPISFGIQLNIIPWISASGQITAEIQPQISNSMGTNEDGYPNIFRRAISTTVRLDDSETLILGGLLRNEEQVSHKQVPILGDVPILGYLFKTTRKKTIETNLVIYITPHVIYKDNHISLRDELTRFDRESRRVFGKGSFIDDYDYFAPAQHTVKDSSVTTSRQPAAGTDKADTSSASDSVKR
jgi:type IV pilus assembly protein PilQ